MTLPWILAHFWGDYVFQTHWMAIEKKRNSWACLIHALTYTIPFLLCGFVWWQLILIGAQHYLQDRWNFVLWFMRGTGHKGFDEPPFAPWSIFLIDNLLHVTWIWMVVSLVHFYSL